MYPVIKAKNISKRFGWKTVLHGLDFEVHQGECVTLLGPNGSGKTTFLRMLALLSRPTSGDIQFFESRLHAQKDDLRGSLGVVLHQPMLYGELTAEENLRFFGQMYNVKNLLTRISNILELVGLAPHGNYLVKTFSRGMQQRLAIGRAVLHEPQVLLLDEPFSNLDQEACEMLEHILRNEIAGGRTVVATSNDLTRLGNLASRFDVLAYGGIVDSIPRASLNKRNLISFYQNALSRAP